MKITSTVNKHGLSRTIPSKTKLLIRQKSKFGCVICRLAIFTYEHINPVFVDAKEHNPENMCILCPNHQRDATDGVLSKVEIEKAYKRVQADKNIEEPSRNGFFDLFGHDTVIQIGPSLFTGFTSIINVDGNNFLSFKKNPDNNPGFQISGNFLDDQGNELFRIKDNEWIGNSKNWDINIVGTKLTIRRKKGEILFSVKKDVPLNKIDITHLNMWAIPFHIKTEKEKLLVGQHDLDHERYVYYGINGSYLGGDCALYLDSTKNSSLKVGAWIAKGGTTYIEGTGICIGRGSVRTLTKGISVFSSNNCPILIKFPYKRKELQLFVCGVLDIKTVNYPDWVEQEFYLNGCKLLSCPFSWGIIGKNSEGKSIELFHVAGNEEAELEKTKGFIGFWANDLLKKSWRERVFECSVWDGEEPNRYLIRVKRSNVNGRIVESEINPESGRWYHPHEFSGVPVWNND